VIIPRELLTAERKYFLPVASLCADLENLRGNR
jgi:hypothetical protein